MWAGLAVIRWISIHPPFPVTGEVEADSEHEAYQEAIGEISMDMPRDRHRLLNWYVEEVK
jgi:hypothetical protein